jgi:hypothetical protein
VTHASPDFLPPGNRAISPAFLALRISSSHRCRPSSSAARTRALPSGVLAPVDALPCNRHRVLPGGQRRQTASFHGASHQVHIAGSDLKSASSIFGSRASGGGGASGTDYGNEQDICRPNTPLASSLPSKSLETYKMAPNRVSVFNLTPKKVFPPTILGIKRLPRMVASLNTKQYMTSLETAT